MPWLTSQNVSSAAPTRLWNIVAPAFCRLCRWLNAAASGLAQRTSPKPAPGSLQTWELAQIERLASDAKRAKRLHANSSQFEQRAKVIRNGILGGRG